MNPVQFLSYRDHDAKVINVNNTYYRLLSHHYKEAYEHFMGSGLYEALVTRNLIISHTEVPTFIQDDSVYKTLLPEQIAFISYPFEWTYAQWIQAAEVFIKINSIALKFGMILKDATPYNFYFQRGSAMLLDTSSFMFYEHGKPWIAYRQFCEAFLGPIALMYYNGEDWTRLLRSKNELHLPFISRQLPFRSWWNLTTTIHIHWHSKFYSTEKKSNESPKGLSREKIDLLLQSFLSTIHKWKNKAETSSHWSKYYAEDLESAQYLPSKEAIIKNWVEEIQPPSILDVGANTGHFTKVLADRTKKMIALEYDPHSVDAITKWIFESKADHVFTVAADITDPIAGTGFMNLETTPLLSRCNATLVLGLALMHHLFFIKRLSFFHIAELFKVVSQKWVIVEFVPEDDQKVIQLKEGAPAYYNSYSEQIFLDAFGTYFHLRKEEIIAKSKRKLFLFEKI